MIADNNDNTIMENRKQTNIDNQPVRSKTRIVGDCTISDNSIAIQHNATTTFERMLRL